MKAEELIPYLTKFITVTLDDGTEISGYISNPEDFRHNVNEHTHIKLVNGLQNSITEVRRIVDVEAVNREDTTEIPVFGETSSQKKADFDEKLNELFDKSLSDTLEVKLPNGKVIKSHSEDD